MLRRFIALAAACVLTGAPAAAQDQVTGFASDDTTAPRPYTGWVFTPSMTYSAGYDDNVLIRGQGDDVRGDVLNVIGPAADLSFIGKRSQFVANYSGGFQMYRTLGTLNNYEQHASVFAQRKLAKHFALFARQSYSATPTTEIIQLIGVPYVRTGSQVNNTRGGFENQFTKRLTLTASYDFQWVKFDAAAYGVALLGGHSHGGNVSLKYQIDERTAVTADGDAQFATVNGPLQFVDVWYAAAHGALQDFTTENANVGIERKLSDTFRVFAAGGVSHLVVSGFAPARTGPAWRVGATKSYGQTYVDVVYARSFVPSFGFGGTLQNEEVSAHVRMPLSRRTYASGGLAWMRNEPLVHGQLNLNSLWVEGIVGYSVSQWLRVEGFYGGVRQTIAQAGGILDRNQFGVQIVTAKPMRIQ